MQKIQSLQTSTVKLLWEMQSLSNRLIRPSHCDFSKNPPTQRQYCSETNHPRQSKHRTRAGRLPHKETVKDFFDCSVLRFYFSSEESSKVSSSFFCFLISLKITYKGQPSNNGGIKTNIIKHPHPLINTSSIS